MPQGSCESVDDQGDLSVRIQHNAVKSLRSAGRASSSRSLKSFRKERNRDSDALEETKMPLRSMFAKDRQNSTSSVGSSQSVDSVASFVRKITILCDNSVHSIDSIDLRINQL
jgi:hypothetical protein